MTTLHPRTPEELTEAVRWAIAAGEAVEVMAGGSKRALGRPVDTPHELDVSAYSGILSYEPEELVLTAKAGTSLEAIQRALAEHAQCLAFEPPDLTPLLAAATGATLGGAIATGLSGPRRPRAGGARDHVLGIAAVSGRGEAFVGGGKVVKNVTGYDMPKLMTGSYGTLAVMTEITLKVLPAPEEVRTLLIVGPAVRAAVRLMSDALQSPADVSGACHIPAALSAPGKPAADAVTALRLEGVRPSVDSRMAYLRERLQHAGLHHVLDRETSIAYWCTVRDVLPFADAAQRIVWRLSVPPAAGAAVLERLEHAIPDVCAFLDWGGGLIWIQLPDAQHARAQAVRAAIGTTGGHAMLIRASAPVRAAVDVFHPQPAALAALSKRVKEQFDPSCVLNPGRMYAGA